MLRALFAIAAAVLFAGAASWTVAARRLRRHGRFLRTTGDAVAEADRTESLAIRDALVGVLFLLVGVAAGVHAVAEDETGPADWTLLAAFVPAALSLPFLGRFQGTTELARDQRTDEEHRRIERLYDVAAAGEDLDVHRSSQRIADALVPDLGDWAIVVLLDNHGEIEALGLATSDIDRDQLDRLLTDYPIQLDVDAGIGLALRSGERVRYDSIDDALLSSVAEDTQHLGLMRALDMRSALIEPLTARGRRLGAIAVVSRGSRVIGDDVVEHLGEIAEQAAPQLDNARLHRDLVVAQRDLRIREEILRAQGESGVEGLLVVSPEGQMVSYNSRFAEMWGIDPELMRAGSDDEALAAAAAHVVDPEAFVASVHAAYKAPRAPLRDEVHFRDGRVFDRYGAPLTGGDGAYLGWAWYFRDISDERASREELEASHERFRSLARTLQESLLPPDLPEIPGVEIAARYHPAGDGSEIGGDFYDVFQIDDQEWCAVVGDICGKGAAAARLTALARYTLRAAAARSRKIDRNLAEVNAALFAQAERDRERNEHRFATATILRFRAVEGGVAVRAASAGHPPPVLVRADGSVTEVACHGSLLGTFGEITVRPTEVMIGPADVLVLFTDGVTEGRRDGELFGDERLHRLLSQHHGRTAAAVAAAVEDAVLSFQGGTARDDIAVLTLAAAPVPPA